MNSLYEKLDSISLAVLDVCEYENDKQFLITRINIPSRHRNKGVGTRLLSKCCQIADLNNYTLFIQVSAYSEEMNMSNSDLTNWYGKFGFTGDMSLMKREVEINHD